MATKKLPAVLANPRRVDPPPSTLRKILDPDALNRWAWEKGVESVAAESAALNALFMHYGIQPPKAGSLPHEGDNSWKSLAMALARDFVPGFSVKFAPKKAVRQTAWKPERQLMLVLDVEEYMRSHPRASAVSACGHIARRSEWLDRITRAPSLYSRYMEAKKSALVLLYQHAAQQIPEAELVGFRQEMRRRMASRL